MTRAEPTRNDRDVDPRQPGEQRSSISGAQTLWDIGEFWDSHDLTRYEAQATEVTDQVEVALGR